MSKSVVMPRILHMLVSVRGVQWRKVPVVHFIQYLDDSGTSPSQHVAVATALVVPAKRIGALEGEWNNAKAKHGFSCFHMSEFVARNYKSEFASWSDDKCSRVLTRILQITGKYGVRAYSFAVFKKDFDSVVPEDFRRATGSLYHYTFALGSVIAKLERWRARQSTAQPFEFVFDWMENNDPRRIEVENVMAFAEYKEARRGNRGQFSNYSFRHRSDIAGLQCVDPLAWSSYQWALKRFRNTPVKPHAKVVSKQFRPDWWEIQTATRENLQEWYVAEVADGRSTQDWEAWRRTLPALSRRP